MATSSALRLGDLGLVWSNVAGAADLAIIDLDVGSDVGLVTAVLLSWFLDRRAENDDVPPSGDPTDRRGWWADEFATNAGDLIGSRMWLLDRAAFNNETLLRAKQYLTEAHQWMVDDKVVEGIDLALTPIKNANGTPIGMLIGAEVRRPGKDPIAFRFSHTWEHLQEDISP